MTEEQIKQRREQKSRCHEARAKEGIKYREKNKDRLRLRSLEYWKRNRERLLEVARTRYAEKPRTTPEENVLRRAWYLNNRDRINEQRRNIDINLTEEQRREKRARDRERYQRNRTQKIEQVKKYYIKNRDAIRKKQAEYFRLNRRPDYVARTYVARTYVARSSHVIRTPDEHRKHMREYMRVWNAKNRDKIREQKRQRYSENPEKFRNWARKARAKETEQGKADRLAWHKNYYLCKKTIADNEETEWLEQNIRFVLAIFGIQKKAKKLRVKELRKANREKNKDHIKDVALARYQKNKDHDDARNREYRRVNRDHMLSRCRRNRARRKGMSTIQYIRNKKITINPWQIMTAANIIGTYANTNKSN